MITIELLDDYFVEVDDYNHTLKKKYIGKDTKTNTDVEKEKIIGYYSNLVDCIERLLRLITLDELRGTVISMREYAETAERAFKRVEEWRETNGTLGEMQKM